MNILIVGVNGFLGRAIATVATANGQNVFGLSRSKSPDDGIAGTYLSADRQSPEIVAEIVHSRNIDVVVDVIAMTLPDTQALISKLDGKVSQYVMLSSCDVYRNYELLHRKAEGTPTRVAIKEESALRVTRYPYRGAERRAQDVPDRHLDDYDKIPIEKAVVQLASNWTVLRLPMIYGPGDRQRRFRWAIEPMAHGANVLVMPRAWADWETTYGHAGNVAAAIAFTFGNKQASKQVFNIAEKSPTNQLTWANRIADVMNWTGTIEISDDPDSTFARSLAGLDLSVPLKIDGRKFRHELGFTDIIDMQTGIQQVVLDETSRT